MEGPTVEDPGVEAPSVEGPTVEDPGVEAPAVCTLPSTARWLEENKGSRSSSISHKWMCRGVPSLGSGREPAKLSEAADTVALWRREEDLGDHCCTWDALDVFDLVEPGSDKQVNWERVSSVSDQPRWLAADEDHPHKPSSSVWLLNASWERSILLLTLSLLLLLLSASNRSFLLRPSLSSHHLLHCSSPCQEMVRRWLRVSTQASGLTRSGRDGGSGTRGK